jgi:membrane-bound lytic murein transglycosylase D
VQVLEVIQRRDVIESTNAALNYLEYLHRYFNGDWFLAIAAYNGGEGTVSGAVQRNANAGRATDFFSLDLRPETRDYVPKLLAVRRLVGNPVAFGLQFAAIPNTPYFASVDPGRQVHLGEAADLAGISRDDMFALNPAFNRMTTPPKGPHRLLLPVERAEAFRQAIMDPLATNTIARRYDVSVDALREANNLRDTVIQPGQVLVIPRSAGEGASLVAAAESRTDISSQLPEHQRPAASSKSKVYKVKSGDSLWTIARRYGVSVPDLAAANGLTPKSTLAAGTRLQIPGGKSGSGGHDANRMTYKVRSGDTLSEIADKFNVSVRELMAWNGLHHSTSLRTGQRLVLYVDPSRQTGG